MFKPGKKRELYAILTCEQFHCPTEFSKVACVNWNKLGERPDMFVYGPEAELKKKLYLRDYNRLQTRRLKMTLENRILNACQHQS